MKAAVILFPGMNCEHETVRALDSVGIPAEIVRSNAGADRLRGFDAWHRGSGWGYRGPVHGHSCHENHSGTIDDPARCQRQKPPRFRLILHSCHSCQNYHS